MGRSVDRTTEFPVWLRFDLSELIFSACRTLHLAANHEVWPHSWDELRDDYETCVKTSGRPWSFEELSRRVVVDWKADTKKLERAVADGSDFRVIWLRDGTAASWKGREPNQIVRNYLRSRTIVWPADAPSPAP